MKVSRSSPPLISAWLVFVMGTVSAQQPWPPGFAGGSLELLRHPDVRRELELVDDQIARLERLARELNEQFRSRLRSVRELQGLPDDEREEKVLELLFQSQARPHEIQRQVEEILLPHQCQRLQQLALQIRLRTGGAAALLTVPEISARLGITEEQRRKLVQLGEEKSRRLQVEIERRREQAERELLDEVLLPEQRAKIDQLIGAPYRPAMPGTW